MILTTGATPRQATEADQPSESGSSDQLVKYTAATAFHTCELCLCYTQQHVPSGLLVQAYHALARLTQSPLSP